MNIKNYAQLILFNFKQKISNLKNYKSIIYVTINFQINYLKCAPLF